MARSNFGIAYDAKRGQFERAFAGHANTVATASTGAIRDLAKMVRAEGRAAIARAGMSRRWQLGFRTSVKPRRGISDNPSMRGFHRIGYANIFERGGTIRGKPLLWVPLPTAPKKLGRGRERLTPKLYIERIGPLHSINRPGRAPLLAGYISAGRAPSAANLRSGAKRAAAPGAARRRGGRRVTLVSVPIFVGIRAATIAKRLNVSAVYDRARQRLPELYRQNVIELQGRR